MRPRPGEAAEPFSESMSPFPRRCLSYFPSVPVNRLAFDHDQWFDHEPFVA